VKVSNIKLGKKKISQIVSAQIQNQSWTEMTSTSGVLLYFVNNAYKVALVPTVLIFKDMPVSFKQYKSML
jgi:hypothetical protein